MSVSRNNDVTYPALGVSSSGKVVIAATVTGNDHYPSASYTVLSDRHPTVRIISEGVGPGRRLHRVRGLRR